MAARIATDQILISGTPSCILFQPDQNATCLVTINLWLTGASIPTSTLSTKSTQASYHRVREAIVAGYLQFNWKDGKSNPADIQSRHWKHAIIWPLLKQLLFWKGDTSELTANTRGVTEFQSKRRSLSLTQMDQGWTNNPNVTCSRYPMKFWFLYGMVGPIAQPTWQIFLIGLFANLDTFHWSRHFCQYLNEYPPSPNKILTTNISYTYISTKLLTFHMCISEPTLSKIHYN